LGTLNFSDGANGFTSSAALSPLRSVTAHTVVLRVPTNSMLVEGATAMWRASGTTAYRSILKPGGSFTRFRFSRIAAALLPPCGTTGMLRSVPETLNCLSFSMLGCACTGANARAAAADNEVRTQPIFLRMCVSFSRSSVRIDGGAGDAGCAGTRSAACSAGDTAVARGLSRGLTPWVFVKAVARAGWQPRCATAEHCPRTVQ
jgi:hypothetical protein